MDRRQHDMSERASQPGDPRAAQSSLRRRAAEWLKEIRDEAYVKSGDE
jgi:hypothetical protein